jgi:hypothetical protein
MFRVVLLAPVQEAGAAPSGWSAGQADPEPSALRFARPSAYGDPRR